MARRAGESRSRSTDDAVDLMSANVAGEYGKADVAASFTEGLNPLNNAYRSTRRAISRTPQPLGSGKWLGLALTRGAAARRSDHAATSPRSDGR